MRKYIIVSMAVSVALLLVFYLLNDILLNNFLHKDFSVLVIFFFIQSFLISWVLSLGEKDREKFPMYALGSVVLRFVSGILFLMVLYLIGIAEPVPLVIQFMGVYLVYLVFEIIVVLANLRRN